MEVVSVKLDPRILKNLDNTLKEFNYSTRTDFIREAIRDKMRQLEKERAINHFERYFGAAKTKVGYKRHRQIRDEVGKEIAKEAGIDLD